MGLTLITRTDCELCEHMQTDLARLSAELPLPPLTIRDVDHDLDLQRRWALKVPVLLLDDALVCYGHLQAEELRRLVARRGAGP